MVNMRIYALTDHQFTLPLKCSRVCYFFFLNFSSDNRFVGGTKSGKVGIWNGASIEKSIQMFTNSDQQKNATLVKYSDGRIYAVAEDASVTVLDMDLRIEKVLGQKVEKEIRTFVATPDYVAVGGFNDKVTAFDKNYIVLVNSFC